MTWSGHTWQNSTTFSNFGEWTRKVEEGKKIRKNSEHNPKTFISSISILFSYIIPLASRLSAQIGSLWNF
jgi:hypothetical protein